MADQSQYYLSKYDPLTRALLALPAELMQVRYTLSEVEALIGVPLPAGARSTWFWTSSDSVRHWRGAGWGARLERLTRSVNFTRAREPTLPVRRAPRKYTPVTRALLALPAEQPLVRYSWTELESLIGEALPLTATCSPSYWRSGRIARIEWERVGWRAQLDRATCSVLFTREQA